jgi:hypothetical protein
MHTAYFSSIQGFHWCSFLWEIPCQLIANLASHRADTPGGPLVGGRGRDAARYSRDQLGKPPEEELLKRREEFILSSDAWQKVSRDS